MPRLQTKAICLRHWDFSETSQTTLLLTESQGLVRALAKGSRRDDPRFSGGIELTDLAEADLILPDSGAMATLAGWDLTQTFPSIRTSMHAFHTAMYTLDLLSATLGDRDPHPRAFASALELLQTLDPGSPEPGDRAPAITIFQWILLDEIGYRPTLQIPPDATTLRFAPDRGGIVPDDDPARAWKVRSETIELLHELSQGIAPTTGKNTDRAAALLAAYLREIAGREIASAERVFDRPLPQPR